MEKIYKETPVTVNRTILRMIASDITNCGFYCSADFENPSKARIRFCDSEKNLFDPDGIDKLIDFLIAVRNEVCNPTSEVIEAKDGGGER